MIRKLLSLSFICLSFSSQAVLAQDDAVTAQCFDVADTMALAEQCQRDAVERADERLNAVWKRVYPALSPRAKELLLDEQRKWIAFKEIACQLHFTGETGSIGRHVSGPICIERIINDRTQQIEAIIEDYPIDALRDAKSED